MVSSGVLHVSIDPVTFAIRALILVVLVVVGWVLLVELVGAVVAADKTVLEMLGFVSVAVLVVEGMDPAGVVGVFVVEVADFVVVVVVNKP